MDNLPGSGREKACYGKPAIVPPSRYIGRFLTAFRTPKPVSKPSIIRGGLSYIDSNGRRRPGNFSKYLQRVLYTDLPSK
jgi:hypothetical protein